MDVPEMSMQDAFDSLTEQVAHEASVSPSDIHLYSDYTDAMTDLFKFLEPPTGEVLVAGLTTPNLAIALDRANLKLVELLGVSPFSGDSRRVLDRVSNGNETVYMSNPNRISGASFGPAELEKLARAVPDGYLVVDEHYLEYLGVSAIPLLGRFENIIVLRALAQNTSGRQRGGFIVAADSRFRHLTGSQCSRIDSQASKRLSATLESGDGKREEQLKVLRGESIRISRALTRLGIQNRITPTDFLLIRVAQPTQVGNYLAAVRTPVENLDGYPGLRRYIRYFIQSIDINDDFIRAFERMPTEYYRLSDLDMRPATVHRGAEKVKSDGQRARRKKITDLTKVNA
jgi:histidinol-phosphate/aromatic aminotransferase/cobyric acid decarboxylase-like protein